MPRLKLSKAHKQNVQNQLKKKSRLKWKDIINFNRRMEYRSRLGKFKNNIDEENSINREKEPPVRKQNVDQPVKLTPREQEIARKKWLKCVQQYELQI
ncbi:Head-specific guanylate cyclase [Frankliniella fusca]|uniref:Head-specific guanylate cyclase n=1 Tax=Frankliniella fusca TaxID=407009 RepID=A0AAE1LNZ5_9NEOP|nr:Head-specific guanylate cyclase [Frankliniella fusca]